MGGRGMKYNVIATVVDVIEADSAEEAIGKLEGMLMEAGFDPYPLSLPEAYPFSAEGQ